MWRMLIRSVEVMQMKKKFKKGVILNNVFSRSL